MTELRKVKAWLSSYCTVDGTRKISGSNVDYRTAFYSPESTQVFTPQGVKMKSQNISFRTIWCIKRTPGPYQLSSCLNILHSVESFELN